MEHLTDEQLLQQFIVHMGVLLAGTAAVALLLDYLKQSSILAYLLVGVIAWKAGIVINGNVVDVLSHTGIILLLFMAGLEVNIQSFLKNWKQVLTVGLGQISLNLILGMAIAWAVMDIEKIETLVFFGLCLTFSSTIVVMGYLRAKREMESTHGQLILGIMVLQDIVAVLALAVLKSVKSAGSSVDAESHDILADIVVGALKTVGSSAGHGDLGVIFAGLFIKLILLGFLLFLAAKYVLKPLFKRFATSSEMLLIGTLGWALGIAALGEAIHFSPEIAAFMAGAALTALPYKLEIEDKVDSLKSFGVIFFFITVGYQLEPESGMLRQYPGVSASVGLAVIGTVFLGLFLGYLTRLKGRTSFMIGGIINQISEFSLILATLALEAGIFTPDVYTTVALACVVSIFISSFWLPKLGVMFRRIAPYLKFLDERSVNKDLDEEVNSEMSGHVILLGYNALSKTIAEYLVKAEIPILFIDLDPDTVGLIKEEKMELVSGIYADIYDPDTWHETGFARARLIISCRVQDQEAELAILKWLKRESIEVPFMASTDSSFEALELYEHGAVYVIQGEELVSTNVQNLFHVGERSIYPSGEAHRARLESLREEYPYRFSFL
jgi:Kef-type K+ transport system membrane component KefB